MHALTYPSLKLCHREHMRDRDEVPSFLLIRSGIVRQMTPVLIFAYYIVVQRRPLTAAIAFSALAWINQVRVHVGCAVLYLPSATRAPLDLAWVKLVALTPWHVVPVHSECPSNVRLLITDPVVHLLAT